MIAALAASIVSGAAMAASEVSAAAVGPVTEAASLSGASQVRAEAVTPVVTLSEAIQVGAESVGIIPEMEKAGSVPTEALEQDGLVRASKAEVVSSLTNRYDQFHEMPAVGGASVEASQTSEIYTNRASAVEALNEQRELRPVTVPSRFAAQEPGWASKLWVLKTRALSAESRGENTDDLWEAYWRVYERAASLKSSD